MARKSLEELTLQDGFLFRRVFLDKQVCKAFIKALLGKEVGEIEDVVAELDSATESPENKGVRFDIYIKGSSEIIAVEMQVRDQHNLAERSRVYNSHLTTRAAVAGDREYRRVKDTYVIFICLFDPFGDGFPIYR